MPVRRTGRATPRPRSARPDPARPAERSTITRTVTRVVEVVPATLVRALAALALLVLVSAIALGTIALSNRRLERLRRRLCDDLGLLQSALLPDLDGRIGEAVVTAAYRPAEGLAAGGDFFDVFELGDGRVGLIVGDVAGHGRDAIPLAAMVRYTVRAYLEGGLEPRAALAIAGDVLDAQLGGRLVTVVAAVLDPSTGRLAYSSAGHPDPVLIGVDLDTTRVAASPLLGAGVPTGRRQVTVTLHRGAAACFFTDGVFDARVAGRHLGPGALADLIRAAGPQVRASEVVDAVVGGGGRPSDDMVVCMIGALSGPAGPDPSRLEEYEVDDGALRDGRAEEFLRACGVRGTDVSMIVGRAFEVADRHGSAVLLVRVDGHRSMARVGEPARATLTGR